MQSASQARKVPQALPAQQGPVGPACFLANMTMPATNSAQQAMWERFLEFRRIRDGLILIKFASNRSKLITIRFYEKHGFRVLNRDTENKLLWTYGNVP